MNESKLNSLVNDIVQAAQDAEAADRCAYDDISALIVAAIEERRDALVEMAEQMDAYQHRLEGLDEISRVNAQADEVGYIMGEIKYD